ncbi:hypothetical protein LEL_10600 [Akanthomyces lecanii RCEF 1005]|uniref:Uncharacterized protein n=1 Tax=Akanthomyces lecanii RCEF 1005 TaxID=1081108 RepID=A0A167XM87_CORDF|nr:hypothetical protein LEL_10600 [Akanthomyces lecanii RCEF 1005]
MMPTSNSIESLDDFRMKNMSMQPIAHMQQQKQQQQQQHAGQPTLQDSLQGDWSMYPVYYNSQVKGGEACLSR